MQADYYLLTRGNVFLASAYDPTSRNPHYYYHRGWNVQALIAYLCGVALPFPGFAGTLGATVSASAQRLGLVFDISKHSITDICASDLGWMMSFVVSFVVYYAICLVWPTGNQRKIREMGLQWEEMADSDWNGSGAVLGREPGRQGVVEEIGMTMKGSNGGYGEKGMKQSVGAM